MAFFASLFGADSFDFGSGSAVAIGVSSGSTTIDDGETVTTSETFSLTSSSPDSGDAFAVGSITTFGDGFDFDGLFF